MTSYVEHLNRLLKTAIMRQQHCVVFGQNIDAGSCLSGLTRGLPQDDQRRVLNTPNSENTLAGIGFGAMLRGVTAAYVMKQLDFLLLGTDHLTNTWNILRDQAAAGSFTVIAIVVDGGYAGPQSSFNGLADICALAQVPGYAVSNRIDSEMVFREQFGAPGFRLIAVSERLFREPVVDWRQEIVSHGPGDLIHYARGADCTIAAFNLAFPQAVDLHAAMRARGLDAGLFGIAAAHPVDWSPIEAEIARTGRLILLDDSKCLTPPYADLLRIADRICGSGAVTVVRRAGSDRQPNSDAFVPDNEALCDWAAAAGRPLRITA